MAFFKGELFSSKYSNNDLEKLNLQTETCSKNDCRNLLLEARRLEFKALFLQQLYIYPVNFAVGYCMIVGGIDEQKIKGIVNRQLS